MTERRAHWDDELEQTVTAILFDCYEHGISEEQTYAVIAAVEDGLGGSAAQAAIQAVREACDEALHEDPMPFGDFRRGYNMAMKVVLSLLDAP